MIKRYKANFVLAFNAGNKRVAFTPHSEGGSYFTTDDETLMQAMEKHNWYGKKFWLSETRGVPVKEEEPVQAPEEPEAAPAEAKHFDTRGEAAAWIKETYGVATRNLRTMNDCIEAAKSMGGIDITIG